MNPLYRTYTFEELARDAFFRRWVVDRDAAAETVWQRWIAHNPDCAGTVTLARAFLLALEDADTSLTIDELDTLMEQAVQPETGVSIPLWRQPWVRVAASLVLVAGLGIATWLWRGQPTASLSNSILGRISPALATGAVERVNTSQRVQQLTLSDGSAVTLYPNSRLRYTEPFGADIREVYLNGQAYFTISKNPKKPFWVYTDKISTQVLGTSFMVNAFGQQARASVAVTEGRVSVYRLQDIDEARQDRRQARAGVVLTPNQRVSYTGVEERFVKSVVEKPRVVVAPPPAAFVFDEAPVAEVFALLEKTYGLTVVFDAKSLDGCFITANLTGESLTDQLALITKITRSTYELVDGQIIIYSRGCDAN